MTVEEGVVMRGIGAALASEGGVVIPLHDATEGRAKIPFCGRRENLLRGRQGLTMTCADRCGAVRDKEGLLSCLRLGKPRYCGLFLVLSSISF